MGRLDTTHQRSNTSPEHLFADLHRHGMTVDLDESGWTTHAALIHERIAMVLGWRGKLDAPTKVSTSPPDDDGNPLHPSSVQRIARNSGHT